MGKTVSVGIDHPMPGSHRYYRTNRRYAKQKEITLYYVIRSVYHSLTQVPFHPSHIYSLSYHVVCTLPVIQCNQVTLNNEACLSLVSRSKGASSDQPIHICWSETNAK
jgi:hypothetical protein